MPTTKDDAIICRSESFDVLFECLLDRVQKNEHCIPVITGPTGSGKSRLALMLAEAINGEIVSADAMQLYRGFDIGTAKATKEEQRRVPHHMIDCFDACETVSVARYVSDVLPLLRHLLEQNKRPIICGGSVQYVSALLDGISFIDIPPDVQLRAAIAREVDTLGLAKSWENILSLDPTAAHAIAPTDRKRIIRFFEIYRQTGLTKSEINRRSREQAPPFSYLPFWLDWTPRAALYEAINERVDRMFNEGLVAEVQQLTLAHPRVEDGPAFLGIGYKEILPHLAGELTAIEAKDSIAQSTRRYAKRQQTWLRKRENLDILLFERKISV